MNNLDLTHNWIKNKNSDYYMYYICSNCKILKMIKIDDRSKISYIIKNGDLGKISYILKSCNEIIIENVLK